MTFDDIDTVQRTGGAGTLTPLPDPPKNSDMRQHKHITMADQTLDAHFRGRSDVLVNGSGYLIRDRRPPRTEWVVPDCVVAFGVDPQAIVEDNGYDISLVGKPPEFVLEVASRWTARNDYTIKRDIYARLGVAEYWRFDHTGGLYYDQPLAGDRLVNGAYQPIELSETSDGVTRGHSRALGLDLCWDDHTLRFYDPVIGEYLRTQAEAEAEIQRLRDLQGRSGGDS